ncbi:hypothetical protein AN403_6163 [Pseudomonas fluorescens]|uniref:Uncharacterized protein n=1 Tax=Pseudomonas fluorescens TaxID=294 RepID=A0A0P8X7T7_PSEFL|nr:hypothetical protein AN403_6163 [Pseudomonas fluorescens]
MGDDEVSVRRLDNSGIRDCSGQTLAFACMLSQHQALAVSLAIDQGWGPFLRMSRFSRNVSLSAPVQSIGSS